MNCRHSTRDCCDWISRSASGTIMLLSARPAEAQHVASFARAVQIWVEWRSPRPRGDQRMNEAVVTDGQGDRGLSLIASADLNKPALHA